MPILKDSFVPLLYRTFEACGLGHHLTRERAEKLAFLAQYLVSENEKYNLTAVTDEREIILKHYADSAAPASLFPKGARVLDVGCGAGFPSLVLALVRPDLRITALDATEKRVRYVAAAAQQLGLTNLETVCMRAEDGARPGAPMRESFDTVTARAVARLPILCELCLPFVRVGGSFIAMKGSGGVAETEEAGSAISVLGGKLISAREEVLDDGQGGQMTRTTVQILKASPTPAAYPRHYSKISKKPL